MSTKIRKQNEEEKGDTTEFVLSCAFWTNFVQQHWGKTPLLLKQPFATPFATSDEVFRGLVRACHRERAGEVHLPLQFFNEQAFSCGVNIEEYLPESDDTSIVGYAERMTQKMEGQRFAFVLNGSFLGHDAQLWMRMRNFLHGLLEQIPAQESHSAIFLGNYASTPFAVHKDNRANFQFIIEGDKRIHLWRDEYVRNEKELQGTHHYENFLDDAITLEGEPGDVFYWPSSCWHVGECVGGLSVCLTVGLRPLAGPLADVWSRIGKTVEEGLKALNPANNDHLNSDPFQQSTETISTVVKIATEALHEVSQNRDLEQTLRALQLNRMASYGWTEIPLPRSWKTLADDETVCGDSRYQILWLAAENHQIIVSANGHSFTIPADSRIIRLIERLNYGAPLRVKSLVEEHAGTTRFADVEYEAEPEGIRALLEKLYSLHAITIAH